MRQAFQVSSPGTHEDHHEASQEEGTEVKDRGPRSDLPRVAPSLAVQVDDTPSSPF